MADETLISHLTALRATLISCLVSLALGFLPMFVAAPYVMDFLIRFMLGGQKISFNYFSPMEVFLLQLKTAFVLDLLLCFPYIAKKIWSFVLPALYENERRFIKSIVLSSSFLFCFGGLFCLAFILPLIIRFGLSFVTESIHPVFGISNILSLALELAVIFGLMFQFPLITAALIKFEIIPYEKLKTKRPFVFIGILTLSALLTPPDIISQLMLTFPTYGLFEIGLYIGKPKKKS